ncbi:MAG TPA: TIGR02266 family protein [Thermoanaerobaculia bacterium]
MIDYTNIPRDSRRVPLQTRVQFKFDRFSGFISEYSANISPGGLFLRTREPRPPGTVLDLEFRLGDGYELIRGRGEVIWVRAEDEGPSRPGGMGIRFLELSEGSRELIYRIVDEHILQGGTPFDVTQKPADPAPAPAPEAEPAPFPELLDRPSAPGRGEPEPAPDAASWLPPAEGAFRGPAAGEDAGAPRVPSPEPFPELLPKPAPPAAPSPMFATSFGSASVQPPPRRLWPWVLLAALVVLAAVAFLLGREVILKAPVERPATASPAPRQAPVPKPRQPAAETGPREASPPAPLPPAAPAPAPPAAPQGPVLTRLDRVTSERTAGGTDILLWGNGEIPPATYKRSRIEGNPPRELIRLSGVRGAQPQTRVVVGTPEVLQVRTGYHPEAGNGELHVVLDLAHPAVTVTGIEQEPHRLRIHLKRG